MAELMKEPSSPQGDYGILKLTYGQKNIIPIHFKWKGIDVHGRTKNVLINDETHFVVLKIKEDMRLQDSILHYQFETVTNNVIILTMPQADVELLRQDKTYYLGAYLVNRETSEVDHILIRKLPVKILESTVYGN